MESYTGQVQIFSGRPDPTWEVDEDDARQLEAIWHELKPYLEDVPSVPSLGYRGSVLRLNAECAYIVYRGVVTREWYGNTESRHDKQRQFERRLLATAPPSVVPDSLIDD